MTFTGPINTAAVAVSPQPTDTVPLWQDGQTPHTRQISLGQIVTLVGASFLPLAGGIVTGQTTFSSAADPGLIVSNNAMVGGTLGVTGAATVGGTLGVTGNATVGGTLGVTGASTLHGGSLSGTFTGSPTYVGTSIFSNAGLASLAINSGAWLSHFGWVQIDANGGGVAWNSSTRPGAGVNPLFISANISGTAGAINAASQFSIGISGDTLDSTATSNGMFGIDFAHNVITGAKGTHTGMRMQITQTGTLTTTSQTQGIGALNPWVTINGTASGLGGSTILVNPQLVINSTAVGWSLGELIEGSITVVSGATQPAIRGAVQMFSAGDQQGSASDYAYCVLRSGTVGWLNGYQVGRRQAPWGIDPTNGAILSAEQQTNGIGFVGMLAKYGVKLDGVSFGTSAWQSAGAILDPSGNWFLGTGKVGPTSTGLGVDVAGWVGGSPTISNGGVSYSVGDVLTGAFGAIITVGAVNGSGTITAWAGGAFTQPPYNAGGAGTSTIALSGGHSGGVGGQAAVVGVTWTQKTELQLQPSGGSLKVGSALMTANGSVATALSSIGPAGSHTTVQEWLTVTNSSGAVRYIPAF